MRANLTVILSIVGVAALLASPATARTRHYAPFNGYYGGYYGGGSYGPYSPSIPTPRYGKGRDFQDGSRG